MSNLDVVFFLCWKASDIERVKTVFWRSLSAHDDDDRSVSPITRWNSVQVWHDPTRDEADREPGDGTSKKLGRAARKGTESMGH